MFKPCIDKRGVALFMVLATLLLVAILANIILTIMLSHSRLTHHQVSRIQAYYAAMAGVNYALVKISLNDGNWIPNPDKIPNTITRTLCRSGCVAPDINEPNLPFSIQQVRIIVGALGSGISGTRTVSARATYTYEP